MTPDERAEAVVTTQIDKWEATHESLRFGQLPRMDLVEAVAAQIREAVEEDRCKPRLTVPFEERLWQQLQHPEDVRGYLEAALEDPDIAVVKLIIQDVLNAMQNVSTFTRARGEQETGETNADSTNPQ